MTTTYPRIDLKTRLDDLSTHDNRAGHVEALDAALQFDDLRDSQRHLKKDVLERLKKTILFNYPSDQLTNSDWALLKIFISTGDSGARNTLNVEFNSHFRELVVPEFGHQYHTQFMTLDVYEVAPSYIEENRKELGKAIDGETAKSLLEKYSQRFEEDTNPLMLLIAGFLFGFANDQDWALYGYNETGNAAIIILVREQTLLRVELNLLPFTLDICACRYANELVPSTE